MASHGAITVTSDVEGEAEALAVHAERTRARAREWLGMTVDEPGVRIRVFIAADRAGLRALQRSEGLAAGDGRNEPVAAHAGYYHPGVRAITLARVKNLELTRAVAHEIAHDVFDRRVGSGVTPLDEGFADVVARWVEVDPPAPLGERPQRDAEYDRRLREARAKETLPGLKRLMHLDFSQFHDASVEAMHYAASWSLVRLLVETKDPQLAGRFRALLDRIAQGASAWRALQATYDVEALERAWIASIDPKPRASTGSAPARAGK